MIFFGLLWFFFWIGLHRGNLTETEYEGVVDIVHYGIFISALIWSFGFGDFYRRQIKK